MPINLTKGQKISLSKEAPNLKIALVGLGWDIKQYDSGADFDLDASIFLLDYTGKCAHDPAITAPVKARATTKPSPLSLKKFPAMWRKSLSQ